MMSDQSSMKVPLESQDDSYLIKNDIRNDIQKLCEKLSYSGEDSLVITTSSRGNNGDYHILGSNTGLKFLYKKLDFVSEFLCYCREQILAKERDDSAEKEKNDKKVMSSLYDGASAAEIKAQLSAWVENQQESVAREEVTPAVVTERVDDVEEASDNDDNTANEDFDGEFYDENNTGEVGTVVEESVPELGEIVESTTDTHNDVVLIVSASGEEIKGRSTRRRKRKATPVKKVKRPRVQKCTTVKEGVRYEVDEEDSNDGNTVPSIKQEKDGEADVKAEEEKTGEKVPPLKIPLNVVKYGQPTVVDGNRCGICGKRFKNAHAVISHSKVHVNQAEKENKKLSKLQKKKKVPDESKTENAEANFKCPKCKKDLQHFRGFQNHFVKKRLCNKVRVEEYKCPNCMAKFNVHSGFVNHLQQKPSCTKRSAAIYGDRDPESMQIEYRDPKTGEIKSMTLSELAKVDGPGQGPHSCKVCGKKFSLAYNFRRHVMRHTNDKPYKCDTCGRSFSLLEGLKRHEPIHTLKPYNCKSCSRRYETEEKLKHHETYQCQKGDRADLKCDLCDHKARSRFALEVHLRSHTGSKEFECEICGKKLATKDSVSRHKIVFHQEAMPFECGECHKCFKLKDTLKKHLKIHGDPKYRCELCGKACTEIGNLKKHMLCHTKEKPFICETCGKAYGRRSLLLNHQRLHTGERPYKCDLPGCDKTFRCYGNLKQHKATHSPCPSHICDVCGRTFKQRGRMSHHRKGHFIEDRWSCEYCESKFKSMFMYKSHLAKNHPEKIEDIESKWNIKLYRCEFCGKTYGDKEDLTRHIYIHQGLKPFKCQYCGRAFNDKSNMRQHEKIHTGDKRHVCDVCYKPFIHRRTLQIHLKNVHKIFNSTEAVGLKPVKKVLAGHEGRQIATVAEVEAEMRMEEEAEASYMDDDGECKRAIESVLQQEIAVPVTIVAGDGLLEGQDAASEIGMIGAAVLPVSDSIILMTPEVVAQEVVQYQ